jgi:hypothetical protein
MPRDVPARTGHERAIWTTQPYLSTTDEADRGQAVAVRFDGLDGGLRQCWVVGEPQVVVGTCSMHSVATYAGAA